MTDNRTTEQTATNHLRTLLDERGIEYAESQDRFRTRFRFNYCEACDDYLNEIEVMGACITASKSYLTPEQAIAATVGEQRSTVEIAELLDEFEHECFMLRVEASETRARDDVVRKSYERIRDEFAGRIAATVGSERKLIDLAHNAWSIALCAIQGMPIPAEWGDAVERGLREHGIDVDGILAAFEVIDE